MICDICKHAIEGVWDPDRTQRLAKREDFQKERGSESASTPKASFAKYWTSISRDNRDDLAYLDPAECVFARQKDNTSFLLSWQEGCYVCLQLQRAFVEEAMSDSQERVHGYLSVFSPHISDRGDFFLRFYTSSNQFFVLCHQVQDPKRDVKLNYEFGDSNQGSRKWSMIDQWMNKCVKLKSHSSCQQQNFSHRPTRLLRINQEHDTFCLVKSSECPSAIRYAALSYCWGPKPADSLLRLLQSSIDKLHQWQPVSGLPKTFRDAMHIAQRLQVDYLWIDRLCIFQDSAEDWQKEASTMQDVYRNAYIGIAALSAKDDEGGCYFERDPRKVAPTLFRLKLERRGLTKTFRVSAEMNQACFDAFQNEPLCQRAWVVQERLLARRTLYFGSKQVFWECRRMIRCEQLPECGNDPLFGGGAEYLHPWKKLIGAEDLPLFKSPSNAISRSRDGLFLGQKEELLFDWRDLIEQYANKKLTVSSNKLVAVSGLANDMKRKLEKLEAGPHQYLAGLWREDLMSTLCWEATVPARRASRYRAPSWSWACLDGDGFSISSKYEHELVRLASFLSAEMLYLGKEETGEVQSGILTLEGPSMWTKLQTGATRKVNDWTFMVESRGTRTSDGPFRLPARCIFSVAFDTLDDRTEEVFTLLILASHLRFRSSSYGWTVWGLALAQVEGNTYRRLGVVRGSMESGMKSAFIETLPPSKQVRIL